MRSSVWLMCALAPALLLGCGGPAPVQLQASCAPAGPAMLLHQPRDRERPMGFGVLDGNILLLYARTTDWGGAPDWHVHAQWYDEAGAPLAEGQELGVTERPMPPRLLAQDGALHGQLWVDPSGTVPPIYADLALGMWAFSPPDIAERSLVPIAVSQELLCEGCGRETLAITGSGLSAGDGQLPIARAAGQVWSAVGGVPDGCGPGFRMQFRPFLFSGSGAHLVQWWDDSRTCALRDIGVWASNLELVTLDPNGPDLGLLLRLGRAGWGGHVHYLRLHEGQPVGQPRRVGGNWEHIGTDGGYQPKAARVGRHILFEERAALSTNRCQVLRRIDFDGRGGDKTPWQLPCLAGLHGDSVQRYHNLDYWTLAIELRTLPLELGSSQEVAAVVWGEHNVLRSPVTSEVDYEEGLYLALLNERGQRISERIRVTPPESTALVDYPRTIDDGPQQREYRQVETFVEGQSLYVVWSDRRPDAPGRYIRRFTCTPLTSPAP